jgi:hypothetical protein
MKQAEDRSRRRFLKASSMLGLAVAFSPGTIAEGFKDSGSKTSANKPASEAADKTAIRPFKVNVPQAELTDLRRRIRATRWPERETVTDASQGVLLLKLKFLGGCP